MNIPRALLCASLTLAVFSGCGGKESSEPAASTAADTGSATASATPAGKAAVTGPVGEYVAGLDAIAAALESVKDEASAKTAAKTIADVSTKLNRVTAEMEKMPKMERGMAFAGAMQEVSRVQMRVATAVQPLVAKPELMKLLGDAMKNIPKVK
jgi:hypothetical protein